MPAAAGASETEPREPRVAVVIPCFNDGRFVTDAVASALDQEPCEIVVVDDGSDDPETLGILERLPAAVRVVHQPNRGLSAARMAGVEASTARFVQPLDADDRLAPGVLRPLADLLDRNPGVNAAWGYTRTFGEDESTFMHWPGFDPWRLTHLNEVPATSLMRRSALLEVGGWDLDSSGFEDWDLNLKAAERGWTAIRIPQPHSLYRQHHQSRMLDQAIGDYEVLRRLLRERHPKLFEERRRSRDRSASSFTVKVGWSLVDATPLISEHTRGKLFNLIRDSFEPAMRPSAVPSLGARVAAKLRSLVGDRAIGSAPARTRG